MQPNYSSMNTQPKLLTPKEFYEELGGAIGINQVRELVRAGRIKSIPIGKRKRLIPHQEVWEFPLRESQGGQA